MTVINRDDLLAGLKTLYLTSNMLGSNEEFRDGYKTSLYQVAMIVDKHEEFSKFANKHGPIKKEAKPKADPDDQPVEYREGKEL